MILRLLRKLPTTVQKRTTLAEIDAGSVVRTHPANCGSPSLSGAFSGTICVNHLWVDRLPTGLQKRDSKQALLGVVALMWLSLIALPSVAQVGREISATATHHVGDRHRTTTIEWAQRGQQPTFRTSAETQKENLNRGFHRGTLEWKSPPASAFEQVRTPRSVNDWDEVEETEIEPLEDTESKRYREAAFREKMRQRLVEHHTRPAALAHSSSRPHQQDARLATPGPHAALSDPWDDGTVRQNVSSQSHDANPFQDPFGDAPAHLSNESATTQNDRKSMTRYAWDASSDAETSAVELKFKLDESAARPVGFQELEDLLLDDELLDRQATPQTPAPTDLNFDVFEDDRQPTPAEPQVPDFPGFQDLNVDDISPFEPTEEIEPQLGEPYQPERPRPEHGERPMEDPTREFPPRDLQDRPRDRPPLPEFDDDFDAIPFDDGTRRDRFFEPELEDRYDEDDVPCDRYYQDRNCCREDIECKNAVRERAQRGIKTISLDISPPLLVDDGGLAVEVDPSAKLGNIPHRTWTVRDGSYSVRGRLTNFRSGKVIITSDDGLETSIPFGQLSRDDLCFVTAYWNLPAECPLTGDSYAIRDFTMITYAWTASALCHKPLYFENVPLERYGHSAGPWRQPLLSAAHFFGSVIMLPYSMGTYPPTECQYALGYYEPGDCAPWMIPAFPLSKRGAMAQTSVVLGLWGYVN